MFLGLCTNDQANIIRKSCWMNSDLGLRSSSKKALICITANEVNGTADELYEIETRGMIYEDQFGHLEELGRRINNYLM